ncbi:MAG TPA: hypothetical protein VGQ86_05985 [Candidatus Limnocylindria bacterium]|nr:hypothetical protein [Candidatus Limnocylindria bacterium]
MNETAAATALHEIDRVLDRTRRTRAIAWFPLTLFGALSIASAPVGLASGGAALAAYWAIAGPLGGIVTAVYAIKRSRALGLEAPPVPYVVVASVLMVGAFAAGAAGRALGLPQLSVVGPAVAISLAYCAFAYIERNAAVAGLALGLLTITLVVATAGMDAARAGAMLALAYGAAFLVTGLTLRTFPGTER